MARKSKSKEFLKKGTFQNYSRHGGIAKKKTEKLE